MTTSSGHTTAILASKVKGTAVYNDSGDKIGTVEDVGNLVTFIASSRASWLHGTTIDLDGGEIPVL